MPLACIHLSQAAFDSPTPPSFDSAIFQTQTIVPKIPKLKRVCPSTLALYIPLKNHSQLKLSQNNKYMENLDQRLTTLTPIPVERQHLPLSQFDAPSGQNVRDTITNPDGDGHVPIDIPEEEEEDASSTSVVIRLPTKFHHNKKTWKLLLTLALVAMYPSLAQVGQLKFTNKSPFETHAFFSNMSVVAYVVAILAAVAFFAMASFLEGFANVNASRICIYMILRCIFCFSVILANLSLVLLLLIPTSNYYWIGYLIISLLFVFTITYNVIDYLKRGRKKNSFNLGSVQRDKKHHQRQESSSSGSIV